MAPTDEVWIVTTDPPEQHPPGPRVVVYGDRDLAVLVMEACAKRVAQANIGPTGEPLPRMVPVPSTPAKPQVAVEVAGHKVRMRRGEFGEVVG